jgi:hypothetical protein
MSKQNEELIKIQRILKDFINHLQTFYKDLGVFDSIENKKTVAREICNRFFSNLICLENHLHLKDSLSSALIQRYNHELSLDFYYLLDEKDTEDKLNKFFNYNYSSKNREWSILKNDNKRDFVPPWVADKEALVKLYKTLSRMAHPNILSIQLNRKGDEFEYRIIQGAITLCILDISSCLNHKPFRDLFPNIEWGKIFEINNSFQLTITEILTKN